jgi:uncharacterized protein (TIGR00725 family)
MKAAARGAKLAGGVTIGILPGSNKAEANAFIDVALATGLGEIRNHLIVRSADALVMVAGGIGTLNELTLACRSKPVIVLEGTGGWADRIRSVAHNGLNLDEAGIGSLLYARDAVEAVDLAFRQILDS